MHEINLWMFSLIRSTSIAGCAAELSTLGSGMELYDTVRSGELDSLVCARDFPENFTRPSCNLTHEESIGRDVVAITRIVFAALSVLGTTSIIVSVLVKRQVRNPGVHPIFVLSIADFSLAAMWITGSAMWLSRKLSTIYSAEGCIIVSLFTVILECVSINLTLVYAMIAYSSIKNAMVQDGLNSVDSKSDNSFSNASRSQPLSLCFCKVLAVYITAWLLPSIIVLVPFGALAGVNAVFRDANNCSCWCVPVFGNVLPGALPSDEATAYYIFRLRKIILTYGLVVGTNYLVVFVLLVTTYCKILFFIKTIRKDHQYRHTETLLAREESQAKKRMFLFLSVFILNGLANFILSYGVFVNQAINLSRGPGTDEGVDNNLQITMYMFQAISVPLQGLLNALVYGWTRPTFLQIIRNGQKSTEDLTYSHVQSEGHHLNHLRRLTYTDLQSPT